jgi:hypothetical protein
LARSDRRRRCRARPPHHPHAGRPSPVDGNKARATAAPDIPVDRLKAVIAEFFLRASIDYKNESRETFPT